MKFIEFEKGEGTATPVMINVDHVQYFVARPQGGTYLYLSTQSERGSTAYLIVSESYADVKKALQL
ncbi:hypothetical protein [Pedobacter antarcticus]|uniref:hypothetical protein n=1 Tax=Pedobacter antarcticus TaxID=34086 RepID=UPI00088AFFAA|nr:hypothetical protein [Pedobacter antarcticus]SDM40625.1 hypothetical protein SAMN04488084_106172 [Pedobacter antarcticus]